MEVEVIFVLALFLVLGQRIPIQPSPDSTAEAKWEEVKGIPGALTAFFLRLPNESCLAIFLDTSEGGELRFSTGRVGFGKDVRITMINGRASYRNGAGNGSVKPNDPAFASCAREVKSSDLFTPELRARFHGFAGIK